MKKQIFLSIAAASCLLADTQTLGEVLVKDSIVSSKDATPATAMDINSSMINKTINIINTEDAVKNMPSTFVRKRFIGDTNAIIATRTSSSGQTARTLVYADGFLLSNLLGNSYNYPPRWSMVTPDQVESAAVIYGPFSAELPGNSVGSTILLTTKMPTKPMAILDMQGFSQDFSYFKTKHDYQGSQANVTFGDKIKNFSWLLSANHLDSYGPPMTFATNTQSTTKATASDQIVTGAQTFTSADNKQSVAFGATSITHTVQNTGSLRMQYDISDIDAKLAYALGTWSNNAQTNVQSYMQNNSGQTVNTGKVNINGYQYDLSTQFLSGGATALHLMNALSLKSNSKSLIDYDISATVYDYINDLSRAATASALNVGTITNMNGTGWKTFDSKFTLKPDIVSNEHKINFGYHFEHYYMSSKKYNTTNWQNGSYNSLNTFQLGDTETQAIYAQDTWKLNKDYKLTYGLRLEGWKAYSGSLLTQTSSVNYKDKNVNAASPKLSLERYFENDIMLRGSYGRATRFPTVAELFNGSNSNNSTTINNPNLNPEVANSYEITLEKGFESGNARVSFFAEDMSNAIVNQTYTTNYGQSVSSFVNVNRILTNGIETFGEVNNVFIDGLGFNGSATYTQSKIKSFALMPSYVGNSTPGIPVWKGSAGALYTYGGFDAALTGNYNSFAFNQLSNADSNHNVYGGGSSFLFINTKLSYKFQNGFGISGGIDNLNNCKAFNYHPLQQRTYFVKAKYEF